MKLSGSSILLLERCKLLPGRFDQRQWAQGQRSWVNGEGTPPVGRTRSATLETCLFLNDGLLFVGDLRIFGNLDQESVCRNGCLLELGLELLKINLHLSHLLLRVGELEEPIVVALFAVLDAFSLPVQQVLRKPNSTKFKILNAKIK